MLPLDGTRHLPLTPVMLADRPSPRREELDNRLCELRQDPRFEEWCHLTLALGLDGLTLQQLAALHAGAVETLFPEVRGGYPAGVDRVVARDEALGPASGVPVERHVAEPAPTPWPGPVLPGVPALPERELAELLTGVGDGYRSAGDGLRAS